MGATPPVQPGPQIQVITGDDLSRGRYSNAMIISHSPEEFILDWLLNSPNGTHLISRIIVSPRNIKRIIEMLTVNLQNYESKHGPVPVLDENQPGFH